MMVCGDRQQGDEYVNLGFGGSFCSEISFGGHLFFKKE